MGISRPEKGQQGQSGHSGVGFVTGSVAVLAAGFQLLASAEVAGVPAAIGTLMRGQPGEGCWPRRLPFGPSRRDVRRAECDRAPSVGCKWSGRSRLRSRCLVERSGVARACAVAGTAGVSTVDEPRCMMLFKASAARGETVAVVVSPDADEPAPSSEFDGPVDSVEAGPAGCAFISAGPVNASAGPLVFGISTRRETARGPNRLAGRGESVTAVLGPGMPSLPPCVADRPGWAPPEPNLGAEPWVR